MQQELFWTEIVTGKQVVSLTSISEQPQKANTIYVDKIATNSLETLQQAAVTENALADEAANQTVIGVNDTTGLVNWNDG